jgi:hypothetical protein
VSVDAQYYCRSGSGDTAIRAVARTLPPSTSCIMALLLRFVLANRDYSAIHRAQRVPATKPRPSAAHAGRAHRPRRSESGAHFRPIPSAGITLDAGRMPKPNRLPRGQVSEYIDGTGAFCI